MKIEKIEEAIGYFKCSTMINDGLDRQEPHHVALEVLEKELDRIHKRKQMEYLGKHADKDVFACQSCGSTLFECDNYCPECGYPVINKELTPDELRKMIGPHRPVFVDGWGWGFVREINKTDEDSYTASISVRDEFNTIIALDGEHPCKCYLYEVK